MTCANLVDNWFKMQSMQRKFGKLLNKGPGDNAKVSVLLNDYEDADRVLAKVITRLLSPSHNCMLSLSKGFG